MWCSILFFVFTLSFKCSHVYCTLHVQHDSLTQRCIEECDRHIAGHQVTEWFPYTEFYLDEVCSHYKIYFGCIKDNCQQDVKQNNGTFEGLQFCNSSSTMRNTYKTHIGCISSKVKVPAELCLKDGIKWSENEALFITSELNSARKSEKLDCCTTVLFQRCLKEKSGQSCGLDSVELLQLLFNNSLLYPNGRCRAFDKTTLFYDCTSNGTSFKAQHKRTALESIETNSKLGVIILITSAIIIVTGVAIFLSVWFLKRETQSCTLGVVSPSSRTSSSSSGL